MTTKRALEILTAKYPQVDFGAFNIDVTDEEIIVYNNEGCEFNQGAYCKDYFDLDGNHTGHKCV